jgi:DNA-binding NarL/FixJ family response regulator
MRPEAGRTPLQLLVLVVDPERSFAEGLALALASDARVAVTWAASGALEALHLLELHRPHVLVVGTEPGDGQAGFLRQVARRHRSLGVVVMSEAQAPEDLVVLIQAGAMGWVPKAAGVEQLSGVVAGVGSGQWWLPRDALGSTVRRLSEQLDGAAAGKLDSLTFRERQVLAGMAEGLSRPEVALRLHLSVNTVRTHIQHVLAKLEVHTSLEAVSLALREGVAITDTGRQEWPLADRADRHGSRGA